MSLDLSSLQKIDSSQIPPVVQKSSDDLLLRTHSDTNTTTTTSAIQSIPTQGNTISASKISLSSLKKQNNISSTTTTTSISPSSVQPNQISTVDINKQSSPIPEVKTKISLKKIANTANSSPVNETWVVENIQASDTISKEIPAVLDVVGESKNDIPDNQPIVSISSHNEVKTIEETPIITAPETVQEMLIEDDSAKEVSNLQVSTNEMFPNYDILKEFNISLEDIDIQPETTPSEVSENTVITPISPKKGSLISNFVETSKNNLVLWIGALIKTTESKKKNTQDLPKKVSSEPDTPIYIIDSDQQETIITNSEAHISVTSETTQVTENTSSQLDDTQTTIEESSDTWSTPIADNKNTDNHTNDTVIDISEQQTNDVMQSDTTLSIVQPSSSETVEEPKKSPLQNFIGYINKVPKQTLYITLFLILTLFSAVVIVNIIPTYKLESSVQDITHTVTSSITWSNHNPTAAPQVQLNTQSDTSTPSVIKEQPSIKHKNVPRKNKPLANPAWE